MSRISLAARVRPSAERTLRIRRRMLQAPVVRFKHGKTGRAVTVAGVVHIAQASYYRQLGAVLTKLEAAGALVCYEGVGHSEETGWAAVGQAERDTWNTAVAGNREQRQAACRYLRWATQEEALVYAASWRNMDLTGRELVQRAGARDLLDVQEGIEDMLDSRAHDQRDALMGIGAATLLRLYSLDRYGLLSRWALSAYPDLVQTVFDERNDRALAALPSCQDAVLIWGSGHLPGLAAGLLRAGYQREASAWLNVGELPPLWASAKVVWAVLRAEHRAEHREERRGDPDHAAQGSGSAGSSGM